MKRAILLFFGSVIAQLCFAQTPVFREYEPKTNPVTEYYKQQVTDQVLKQLNKIDWGHVERTTNGGTALYTVPVVVHVLHNYGPELIADSVIYDMISNVNSYFLKTRPDTINIIDKYKAIAANTQIAFKLATVDPNGNQTKGVEHIFTYLTYGYDDEAKINQWPQDRYLNVWVVDIMGIGVGGFSYNSYNAAYEPYYDGVELNFSFVSTGSLTAHYLAKYLNLTDPCSPYGSSPCTDNDLIPDTPPCSETLSYACTNVYDTTCDTPNMQNIMSNLDSCGIMFTYGQGQYMQYILQISIGNRDSLITPNNFTNTGMNQPMPDMPPVADYSIFTSAWPNKIIPKGFFCENQYVTFTNKSWNDTIIAAAWTFSNEASTSASNSLTTVVNKFHKSGWVTVSLAATGNNTGTTTLTNSNTLYIADSVATNAVGYMQEFLERGGLNKWPIFNYYNNGFKWEMAYVGCFDNTSIEYTGYDTRIFPQNMTGTPQGDVDDIYTPAFDLTGFGDPCYLNFMSSGATSTSKTKFMNDSLEIDYSVTQTATWVKLTGYKGNDLDNKGTITTPYTPASMSDWVSRAVLLPDAARTAYTLFRFRYYPGADSTGMSTGNNFYLDHINFNSFPEDVAMINSMADGVSVQPNPTQGNSYVIIKDKMAILMTTIEVMDITGKIIYRAVRNNNSNTARIELPGSIFTSKGLYLVHIITDRLNQTEKLVVY